MRVKEQRTYPARTEVVEVARICDLCGCRTSNDRNWPEPPHPACDMYAVRAVQVSCEIGDSYGGEGGDIEETSFDICPECFVAKVVPALKALGAEPTTTERSW
jgi:hypothetical protein